MEARRKRANSIMPVYFAHSDIEDLINQDDDDYMPNYEVAEAVLKVIPRQDLDAVQKCNSMWRIYIFTHEARAKLISTTIALRGRRVTLSDKNSRVTNIRDPDIMAEKIQISGLPLSVANTEILEFLQQFPQLNLTSPLRYSKMRDANNDLTSFRDGNRFAFAEGPILPCLPRKAVIAGFTVEIYHQTQKKICKACGELGHKHGDIECDAYTCDQQITIFRGYKNRLSNFYECPHGCQIIFRGEEFKSCEHGYQKTKATTLGKENLAGRIKNAKNAFIAKKLADQEIPDDDPEWIDVRDDVMRELKTAQANCCVHFKTALKSTQGTMLAEGTSDLYWATGLSPENTLHTKPKYWKGKNRLGDLLADLRTSILIEEENEDSPSETVENHADVSNNLTDSLISATTAETTSAEQNEETVDNITKPKETNSEEEKQTSDQTRGRSPKRKAKSGFVKKVLRASGFRAESPTTVKDRSSSRKRQLSNKDKTGEMKKSKAEDSEATPSWMGLQEWDPKNDWD